jgi:aminopeptidase N
MPPGSGLLELHSAWLADKVRIVECLEVRTEDPLPLANLDSLVIANDGRMENIGGIVLGEGTMRTPPPDVRGEFLPHETFHQWQGNMVGFGHWRYRKLNEGSPGVLCQGAF